MITGECFCGEIRYEINGELKNPRRCHCSRCRKAFSGAGSAMATVVPSEFSWTSGSELLQTYESKDGPGLAFCSRCGSTLVGLYKGEVMGVTLGTLNEDPPIKLDFHIFVGSKACWDHIGGETPQYEEWPH